MSRTLTAASTVEVAKPVTAAETFTLGASIPKAVGTPQIEAASRCW